MNNIMEKIEFLESIYVRPDALRVELEPKTVKEVETIGAEPEVKKQTAVRVIEQKDSIPVTLYFG
jgi:hypothetical protein